MRGERAGGGKRESGGGEKGREKEGEAGKVGGEGGEGDVSVKYCLYFGMEPMHVVKSVNKFQMPLVTFDFHFREQYMDKVRRRQVGWDE